MKKRALKKDFHVEIKKSLNRFLSIFFIVALGVAFFSGIQSAAPDMRATGDWYFDDSKLMDLRVISTMGLTGKDLEALGSIEGVERVNGSYIEDVYCGEGDTQEVLHVESVPEELNQLAVIAGDEPKTDRECFLDASYAQKLGIQPGDVIEIMVSDEENSSLKYRKFTVSGYGYSPCYISFSKGSTTLGTGAVAGVMYVPAQAFDAEVYSVAYMTVSGAREETAFTDAYDRLIDAVLERVEAIEDVQCEIRYDEVVGEADEKLAEAKQEVADGKKELEDARKELEDGKVQADEELSEAESELTDGEKQLEDGERELKDAQKELADGEKELADGEKEIEENEKKLADGRQQFAEGQSALEQGEQEYQSGLSKYQKESAAAQKKLEAAQKEINKGKKELKKGWEEYRTNLAALDAGEQQLVLAEQELAEQQARYDAGAAQLAEGRAQYEAGVAQAAEGRAQYEAGMAQLEAGWAAYQQSYDAVIPGLQAALEGASSQLAACEQDVAARKAAIDENAGALAVCAENISSYEAALAAAQAARDALDDSATPEEVAAAEEAVQSAVSVLTSEKETYAELNSRASELQSAYDTAAAQRDGAAQAVEAAEGALNQASAEFAAQETVLNGTAAELAVAKQQLDASVATLASTLATLEAKEQELAAASEQLSSGWEQINTKKEEIAAGRTALAEGKKTLEDNEKKLSDGQKEIDRGYQELEQAKSQLSSARQELDLGWAELNASQSQLADGEQQLEEGRRQLSDARAEIADAKQQITDAKKELEENRQKIEDGWKDYETGKQEAEEEIADGEQKIRDAEKELQDAEQEIADAEAELADLKFPEWYINDRSVLPEYSGLGENAERMGNLAKVIPLLFFLVAALISLTTMTRMVEEQRTQIGTLKALGYSKWAIASKYLKYAFWATMGGSAVGILIGEKLLPWVIIHAYGIIYLYQPKIIIPYNVAYIAVSAGAALTCTLGATFMACWRELQAVPAQLMRPPAPKQGKRVLLEYLPFLWRKLSFSWKSTIRNLLRYKKRFLMTIFGIGGCMGLLMVGYGLQDSIMDIGILQFDELQQYDAMVILDADASEEKQKAPRELVGSDTRIAQAKEFYMHQEDIRQTDASGKNWSVYVYVPENLEDLDAFVTFRDRETKEVYELTDEGAIITEKIAGELDLHPGDTVYLKQEDGEDVAGPLAAICEKNLFHYLYMTPALYEKVYGKQMHSNSIFLCSDEGQGVIEKIGEALLQMDAVLNITYTGTMAEQIDSMLGAMDIVMIVLIVSAGMLAFVVLYNLNNININERRRELATLKVLGFYDGEVGAYVYRENILLTFLGALLGVLIGKLLHAYVISTVEVDACMFGRNINPDSFVYSILFTIGFSVIVNFVMYFKLKKIDMVESLKSIE